MYVGPLLVESSVMVIFYALCGNYYSFGTFFSNQEKAGVKNCFKPLILSVFTIAASRLKSEKKRNNKY